jgi:hypothetical protein
MANQENTPLQRRRLILIVGAGVALLLTVALIALLATRGRGSIEEAASQGGQLVVETGRDDDVKLDPSRPLRCFVAGKMVGEVTVADCAKKNGVAPGALDVGLDTSGALAAATAGDQTAGALTPVPADADSANAPIGEYGPQQSGDDDMGAPPVSPAGAGRVVAQQQAPNGGGCWRQDDADDGWTPVPGPRTLSACARALFAGQCDESGYAAPRGRWGDTALRLRNGQILGAAGGQGFHVVAPPPPDCAPPVPPGY